MTKSIKTCLLTVAALLGSISAYAHDLEVDGIYYNITSDATVEVTFRGSYYYSYYEYSGDIIIPSTVTYSGKEYSVTSIGDEAFGWCSSLTSVTIPNSVTSIGERAFSGCDDLTSVTIPNSVMSIGEKAFVGCSGLTLVTIPNSVTSIGDYTFEGCSGLTSVTIGNSVTSIGNAVFYGCSGLTSVTIPNSVTSIGHFVFYDCSGLTSVTIPNSVTSIGRKAFSGCSGLTSVTIPNSVKSIGQYAFSGCSGLTSVTIPNSVTSIEYDTFKGCSGLTSVTIPNSVTSIGSDAFFGCSGLTSVTIGSGVKSIYGGAFANCPELLDVYCYAEKVPYTGSNAFDGSYPENVTLHVPDGSIDSYKAEMPWSSFGKIMGLSGGEPEVPEVEKCATPVVSYADGKLSMACETEGAEFVTKIVALDHSTFYDAEVELSATYNIEVYASKANFENSDTISVALVWVENGEVNEETSVISVPATPVLVQGNGGILTVSGVVQNTEVVVYTIDGMEVDRAVASDGTATIYTGLQSGTIVVVKFGNKSVKVRI